MSKNSIFDNNNTSRKVNYLATTAEKQQAAGHQLPSSLSKQIKRLNKATLEFKKILTGHLPDEILEKCWVVTLGTQHITISVTSITAANHIHYMSKGYSNLLSSKSDIFKNITAIKVIISDY